MNRPELNDTISPQDFKDFYWLKEELVTFCKTKGISSSGGKIEIADRISRLRAAGVARMQQGETCLSFQSFISFELQCSLDKNEPGLPCYRRHRARTEKKGLSSSN